MRVNVFLQPNKEGKMAKYKYELTIKLDRNSPQRLRKHLAEAGFMITVAGTASNEPMVLNNSFKTGSIVYMNFDEDFEYS